MRFGSEADQTASTAEAVEPEPEAAPAAHDPDGAESAGSHPFLPARPRRFWMLPTGKTAPIAVEMAPEETADPLAAFSPEAEIAERHVRRHRWSRDRWLAVAVTLVAIAEAVLLVWGVPRLGAAGATDGRLRVTSDPAGAEVVVDGQARGAAPVDLRLPPGMHRVQVRQGGAVRDISAEVRAGSESHHYVQLAALASDSSHLAAAPGSLAAIDITSDPAGARVSIDGKAVGVTPLQLTDLPPGLHEVLLAGPNGNVSRRVRLSAGAMSSVSVAMPKTPPASAGWVRVELPIQAQIYEGGDLIGTTEMDRLMLPAGRHTIRVVNKNLNFQSEHTVEITPGATRMLNVPLPNGRLSVNALPWAIVWVDGQSHGETPIGNLAVPIGSHEIVLRHPELGERRQSVSVTLGGVTRIGVDLRK